MVQLEKIGNVSDIPSGTMRGFSPGGRQILVANVGGEFYAIDAVCSHMAGYLPAGRLDGKIVTCPVHGCQYDVTTGEVVKNVNILVEKLTGRCTPQKSIKLKREGDEIYIEHGGD